MSVTVTANLQNLVNVAEALDKIGPVQVTDAALAITPMLKSINSLCKQVCAYICMFKLKPSTAYLQIVSKVSSSVSIIHEQWSSRIIVILK